MYLSSNDVALSLLSNRTGLTPHVDAGGLPGSSKPAASSSAPEWYASPGVTYDPATPTASVPAEDAMMMEMVGRMRAAHESLRNGAASPFDPEVDKLLGGQIFFHQNIKDPRMEFEGNFGSSLPAAMGTTAPQRDAEFSSRGDAMAYAFHFGSELAKMGQSVAIDMSRIDASSSTMLDSSGKIFGLASDGQILGNWDAVTTAEAHGNGAILRDMRHMETQAASLANLFSFDSASATRPVYEGTFSGFSISHGTLGKIMDVAANGSVTLYDAEGKGYSAAEYSAANIDGGIPQLRNDLRRQADSQKSSI